MKEKGTNLFLAIVVITGAYLSLSNLPAKWGWYGAKRAGFLVGTTDISDAKKNGFFVKELSFRVNNFNGSLHNFVPYMGRRIGGSPPNAFSVHYPDKYPYEISFSYNRQVDFNLYMRRRDLGKFDSADHVWGYMAAPAMKDSIVLDIESKGIRSGTITVW